MPSTSKEPVAIVGSACRFAGDANSPSKLWELLRNPRDLLQEIPNSRFNARAFYHPDGSYHGHANVQHAYLLDEDPRAFDAEFFGIKSVEARAMDPQQRMLIETAYEGLEAAGMAISNLKGSDTAVYVGVMFDDYGTMLLRDLQDIPTYYATGTGRSILSNRLSYFFDWHGPSITVDTACSSSLVAIHMAVQALRAGDAGMALACGSNLILDPVNFIIESKLNMLSPEGRSRMWDQDANGYARGEGVAVVVLKTLSAALKNGDHVECIIRETALNQDGSTGAITMPSSSAQESLIRRTYANAGLDISTQNDRPQYFEAHGTGTPAGDPIEAKAVHDAFNRSDDEDLVLHGGHPLYVGSVKTVFGHTEGTAGIAAVLKTSLALQHALIPPNLLFDTLSDQVAPFYKNVEILRTAKAWPDVSGGTRRASVNSFGFGGANAHAILEHYDNKSSTSMFASDNAIRIFTPFVFSAFSGQSLRAMLSSFMLFLEGRRQQINPRDIAWTLQQRRSLLPYRVSFAASSLDDLKLKIAAKLEQENTGVGTKALPSSKREVIKILGIFTGQGAQYARMGAELIEGSETARRIIQGLELDLASLPDGPTWSLQAELLADASCSRINEAVISLPLSTAIQILLVDLLRLAGVCFDTVVGHSSGEIAAAYAAGYLTARDAISVAYYRGFHVHKASSPNGDGTKGAMLAVGGSFEDTASLCNDETFSGRIAIAASNSSSSVTVSGDEDAIAELQDILNDEKKFNRRLKVDKAYHSRHMLPCHESYVVSLKRHRLELQEPRYTCKWYSSVYNRLVSSDLQLSDMYWAENMTQPVLFAEALSSALAANSFDIALEVGAHPALKGPTTQTFQDVSGYRIPYHGLLTRDSSAVEASMIGLGYLWSYLDRSRIDLDTYEKAMANDGHHFTVVKDLPKYQWNHETKYWHEPRISRKIRLRQHQGHSLLGDQSFDSTAHHMSWRNLLRENKIHWVSGHKVQGQTVFPAAGYIGTALEASRLMAESQGQTICLIELSEFTIYQPVVLGPDDRGIEVLVSMVNITREQKDRIRAEFSYSAALEAHAEDLTLIASAHIAVQLGNPSKGLLPVRKPALTHVVEVDSERFYSALADLGYNFSGRFRSLSGLRRKHCTATCLMKVRPLEDDADHLLIHPAELDAALQSIILAYSYPGDEQLRNLHLPTSIRQISVNPALLAVADRRQDEFFHIDSAITPRKPDQRSITGHVDLYVKQSSNAAIRIQSANFMPLGGAAVEGDRRVFSRVHWVNSRPDGLEAGRDIQLTEKHRDTVRLLERIATFYLRKFDREVPPDHPIRSDFTAKWYLNYARYVTDMVETCQHKWVEKERANDSLNDITAASKPFSHLPDVQIMHLTGEQMPRVFNGETTILEQFRASNILDRYYADGFGLKESAQWVSRMVKQIVDRYPHMNILEIGAGTGGATKAIFREIGQAFRSYTYTDISAAFFENAASILSQHRDRMIFKTFDVEKDPLDQGFAESTYDLVVAFFVIHATSDLERSLLYVRKVLRPGGFLIVGEGQEGLNGVSSSGFIFGTLPGWWLGTDKGRILSPHVSPQEWDELLRKTGFSGVDTHPPNDFQDVLNVFHFVSQAVDDQVDFFREPLSPRTWRAPPIKKLAIVGGDTDLSTHFVEGIAKIFKEEYASEVYTFKSLLDVDYKIVDAESTVCSFQDLDNPVFKDINPEMFEAFKNMFKSGKLLLWVTRCRRDDELFSNMTVGWGRVAAHESPELRLQQLDIADPNTTSPHLIAEILLRFHAEAYRKDDLLRSVEPELVIDNQGKELIPRLRPISKLNDRYNSSRRAIVQENDIRDLSIVLQPIQNEYKIMEQSRYLYLKAECSKEENLIELHTTHAIISALKTPIGHRFLVLGVHLETRDPYLALVPTLASVVRVPAKSTIKCEVPDANSVGMLLMTAAELVAMTIVSPLFNNQTLVVHNAASNVAHAIGSQAAAKNVRVVYSTDSIDKDIPVSWIRLPQYLSRTDVEEILPCKPSAFIGFSSDGTHEVENEGILLSALPSNCHVMTAYTIFNLVASEDNYLTAGLLGDVLHEAVEYARKDLRVKGKQFSAPELIRLDNLGNGTIPRDPLSIINWKAATTLPIHAARLDTSNIFRGANGTYWIVGMSGALGISLCDWMISKGARNLVVTSRNPVIDPKWITDHQRKGATVAILACNVTDEAALNKVHRKICNTFPPIVGVMMGAMVLRDTSIRNMSFTELTDVINPKVLGSIYLDRIFRDIDLDFFLLISSINCVIGNLGQANYAAANTFMCSLAAQRRKRGLRAATINGGAIIGSGYMERESSRALDLIVQKLHMMRMSEEDWHQSICEGIDACRLDSIVGAELTSGLSDVPFDTPNAPCWFLNPMFSSFVVQQKADNLEKKQSKATATIQELLKTCQTKEEVHKVVKKAFATQLRNVLQMTMSDDDLMSSRSVEIGLDSLVSVDIRSWFLKNLQISVPVLKIMGDSIMASIVDFAVECIPLELLPQMAESQPCTESAAVDSSASKDSLSDGTPTRAKESETSSAITTPLRERTPPADGGFLKSITAGGIDWEAEARPSADLATIPRTPDSPPVMPPSVIVLTGASGLLGRHLLDFLLKKKSVKKIVCLAVRNRNNRLQKRELLEDSRVVYHEGELLQPRLGLSVQQTADIFNEADVVIHNGADTSHLKYFADLQACNVGSTQTLVRLCLPRRIPIHYVSSAGLAVLFNSPVFTEVCVTGREHSYPAADGAFGYLCSKWTNERFLEQVHDLYGLPVCIHRPSTILREGLDAVGARAQLDWVNALLHWARTIEAVPRIKNNHGALDLVRTSTVCESIFSHIMDDSNRAKKEVIYAHQVGDVVIPLDCLQDIGHEQNKTYDLLPMGDWLAKAIAAGLHPAIAALIELMDAPGAPSYPRIIKGTGQTLQDVQFCDSMYEIHETR